MCGGIASTQEHPQGRESLHVDEIGSPTALTFLRWSRCHFASSCRSRTAAQSWCRGMGSSLIKSCEKNGSGRGKGSDSEKQVRFFFSSKFSSQPSSQPTQANGPRLKGSLQALNNPLESLSLFLHLFLSLSVRILPRCCGVVYVETVYLFLLRPTETPQPKKYKIERKRPFFFCSKSASFILDEALKHAHHERVGKPV